MLLILALFAAFGATQAAAAPSIGLTVEADDVLFGEQGRVALEAASPAGQPWGYNLSYRVELPAGVEYVPNSVTAPVPEPKAFHDTTTGVTTLVWANLADLAPASSNQLTFRVSHSRTGNWGPGSAPISSYRITADAYVHDIARWVPQFDGDGVAVAGSYTGSATDDDAAAVQAIKVTHENPGKILRGVHEHRRAFSATVTNNSVSDTQNVVLHEYLPAGLEWLGCGTTTRARDGDKSTNSPTNSQPAAPDSPLEYPDSGPLNGTDFSAGLVPDCIDPDAVETVDVAVGNPEGMASGVYTRLTFTIGTLTPGQVWTVDYVAGVPLAENTMTWSGGATPPAEAPNLDNNGGRETHHLQGLPVTGIATGNFAGAFPQTTSDSDTAISVAMDLIVGKEEDRSDITIGAAGDTTWTLRVRSSEYRSSTGIVVTDVLPDGLEAVSASPNWTGTAAGPGAGETTLTWAGVAGHGALAPTSDFEITLVTRAKNTYADSTPVASRDTWSNRVAVTGDGYRRCNSAPAHIGECTDDADKIWTGGAWTEGDDLPDSDAAEQQATEPSIAKTVQTGNAYHAALTDVTGWTDVPSTFSPGDHLWYRLQVDFPDEVNTHAMKVTDFVPSGTSYVAGTTTYGTLNTVTPQSFIVDGDTLTWDLGDVAPGAQFDVAFQVQVDRPATAKDGHLVENLMKTSFMNRAGRSFPLRDLVGLKRSQPEVAITTGVSNWTGNTDPDYGPNTDDKTVPGGGTVIFRVDPRNTGSEDAKKATIRTVLPSELDCTMITAITGGTASTCTGGIIEWTGVDIDAGATPTLFYTATLPNTLAPGTVVAPEAGVVSFETIDNNTVPQTWYPLSNIDLTITDDPATHPGRRVPAADDPTSVTVAAPTIAHTIAAPFSQTGNSATLEGSIGETVKHTTTVTLPTNTTLTHPKVVDTVGAGLTLCAAGTFTATLGGAALPADWSIDCDVDDGTITVTGPASYLATTTQDIVITYDSVISNTITTTPAVNNVRGAERGSSTTFTWGGPAPLTEASPKVTIVEPDIAVSITPAASELLPGQTVDYVVQASNASGTNVSTANNTVVVVAVPAGLTPTAHAGGTWDPVARTITYLPTATIAPGGSDTARTITLRVDNDVTAGQTYTVTARADTESLPAAGHTDRRTATTTTTTSDYRATASAAVTIPGSTLTKTANKTSATRGEIVTHTLSLPLAANVRFYDLTIIDTLPTNLAYVGPMTSTCTPAGGNPGDCTLTAAALPQSGQMLGFTIGDVAQAPVVRTITITYTTRVTTAASNGNTLTNSAVLYSNVTNGTTPTTIPTDPDATFDTKTPPATATTNVVEPTPTITKTVGLNGGAVVPSGTDISTTDTANYTITVGNTGTSPLHDLVIVDTPDTQLLASSLSMGTVTAPAGVTVTGPTPAGPWATVPGTLTWRSAGPLAPGESVVIRYSAKVNPAAVAHDDPIDNSVEVTEAYGLSTADRTTAGPGNFATYTAGPATTTLKVKLPTLGITKTAATPPPGTVPAGAATTYTIAVANTGPVRATDLEITDTLPTGVRYTPGTATAAITNPAGPAVGFAEIDGTGPSLEWTLPELASGSTLTITLPVTVDGDVDDALTLTNTAGVTSYEQPLPVTDPADILTVRRADVAITKTGPTTLNAGEIVEWTLTATNAGPSNARNVVVTDSIPAETTLVAVTPTPACTAAGRDITCALGTLNSGASRTVTIRARVNANTTVNILNTATITTTDPDPDPTNNTSNHPTTVGNRVDLTLTKTGAAPRIVLTLTNTYTLTARNLGPSDSYDTTVVDTLPAGLTALSATTAAGTCTVTNPRRVDCDLGTLVADGTAIITVVARGDVVGTHTNTATVDTGRGTDADPSNNTATAVVVVDALADLAITKTGPAQIAAGGQLDYTLTITNNGPSPATGVTITDELPAGMQPTGASAGCTAAGRTVTCAVGDLAVGATAERTVTARVDTAAAGQTLQNVARVSGNEAELNLANNTDTAETRVGEAADLRVVKNGSTPFAGGEITYTLDVINDGPTTARNAVLVDELPEGLTYVRSLATQGACTADGRRVDCGLGNIRSNAAVTVQIVATVDAGLPAGTAITNVATVGSDTLDPDPGNNTTTITRPTRAGAAPKSNIVLTKRTTAARPRVGEAFDYVLTVTNRGPGRATGVTVNDPIPAGVRVLGVRSTRGRCVTDGPVVRCAVGTLAARRSATVTVRVMMSVPGNHINRAVASADGTPAVAARLAVAGVRATNSAGRITVTKSSSRRRVTAGGVVDFRIRVAATRSSVSRVKVCDTLPKGMVFARATGAKLSGRRACWTVDWLDPGKPKAFTVRARTEATASGSLRNVVRATAPGTRPASGTAQVKVVAKRAISPGGVTG